MQLEELWTSGKKYRVIYIDPPWKFDTFSEKGKKKSADRHYKTMTFKEIAAMPMNDIAADDCVMFLWCTPPLLNKQIAMMENDWRFRFVTVGFNWTKLNKKNGKPFMGTGYYTRQNPEYCVIGRKGNPGRPNNRSVMCAKLSPIREHSRKPDDIRDDIVSMYGGPRCEVFARVAYPGWDAYGNEVEKFQPGLM